MEQASTQYDGNGQEHPPATTAKKTREIEVVKMSDGRAVEFAGKKRLNKESFTKEGKHFLRMDWRNGETRLYELNPGLLTRYALHGAEQKYGDRTAGEENLEDAIVAVDDLHEQHTRGEWNITREGTGDGFAGSGVIIRALGEVTGKSQEEVKAFITAKLEAGKAGGLTRQKLYAAFRASNGVGPVITRMEAEKGAKAAVAVDVERLLNEMR
jgi:hypothetical protein